MTDGIEALESENIVTCRLCQKRLELGAYVLNVQNGVIGFKGFVQTEDPVLFCSEACVVANFGTPPQGGASDDEERVP